jgi:glycosyltransferase involved in cell wall biosynthesis
MEGLTEAEAPTRKTRLRILLLTKSLGRGGAERLLVDFAANGDWADFDYETAYVLSSEDDLVESMRDTGSPVHCLGARGDWDLSWLLALRRLLVRGNFDVVHAHLPYAAGTGRMVTWTLPVRNRPKFIYTEHNVWGKTAAPVRFLNRMGVQRDAALVAVSESVRDALPTSVRDRAVVVVHGVELSEAAKLLKKHSEVRAEVRHELGVPEGDVLVLTVANLRPEKAYEVLLAAARSLLDRDVPVTFVSIGRGPLEDELKMLAQSLHLGDRFKFLGSREDALRLMAGSDLFVLSSSHEGLPVALMEATSVGAAIVVTAVGEMPRILTNGVDGLVVPPGEPDSLAEAIERLVRDPRLRSELGKAATALSERFDVGRSARKVEELYRRVTSATDLGL